MANFREDRFFSEHNCLIELSQVSSRQEAFEAQSFRAGFRHGAVVPQEHPHQQAFNALSLTYEEVVDVLNEECRHNEFYYTNWQMAENIFRVNPGRYTNLIPDKCHIAIIAYTSTPIYADFNAQCRNLRNNRSSWSTFNYKSLYWFLAHCLNRIPNQPSLNNITFRGENRRYRSLQVNKFVWLDHFTSSSTDLQVADGFSEFSGTVIEFPPNVAGIGVSNHSQFPFEQEILIFPWNTFIIKKIYRQDNKCRIVLERALQEEFANQAESSIETNQRSRSFNQRR